MASYFQNHQQSQECFSRDGHYGGAAKNNIVSNFQFRLSVDQLRRKFHRSLDLNRPVFGSSPIELNDPPHFPLGWKNCCENKVKMGCLMRDAKKRCLVEMEMNQNAKSLNLDLTLRLSPPGLYSKDDLSDQSEISSPTSQRSCMSLDLNSNEDLDGTHTLKVASLIVMGCTHCLMYVMVSEVDPECPKCKSSVLLDLFLESPAKKMREC